MSDSPASILFDEHGSPIATASGITGVRLAVDTVGKTTIDIGLGNVEGSSLFGGFGERNSVEAATDGVDIWQGAAERQPLPDSAGEAMVVVSTSVQDAAAGTGAQTLDVHYLDATGAEQVEVVSLTGTTPVALVATDVRYVQFMHSSTVGSRGVAEGDITIYKNGATSTVYNVVKEGGNMSLTSARMVPLGKKCLVDSWHATESKDKKIAFRLRSTDSSGHLHEGVFIFKDAMYLTSDSMQAGTGFIAPALSVVKVSGWAPVTGAEASCSWSGTLVDE
jgi:hypothetical protein